MKDTFDLKKFLNEHKTNRYPKSIEEGLELTENVYIEPSLEFEEGEGKDLSRIDILYYEDLNKIANQLITDLKSKNMIADGVDEKELSREIGGAMVDLGQQAKKTLSKDYIFRLLVKNFSPDNY